MPKTKWPTKNLTEETLRRVRADKGRVEVRDAQVPGLRITASPTGLKSWVFVYRVKGSSKLRKVTLGHFANPRLDPKRLVSIKAARAEARRIAGAAGLGEDLHAEPEQAEEVPLAGPLIERWLEKDQRKKKSHYDVQRAVNRDAKDALKDRPVDEITRKEIKSILKVVQDRGAGVQARRLHSYLHRFFNWCVEEELLNGNPMGGAKKPGEKEKKRQRLLTKEELVEIWKAAETVAWPGGKLVQLFILTGARPGMKHACESGLKQLRWKEITKEEKEGQVFNVIKFSPDRHKAGWKTDEPYLHVLSPHAIKLMESFPRLRKTDLVFPGEVSGRSFSGTNLKAHLDDAILTARQKVNPKAEPMDDWWLYDIRSAVSTGLQRLGVPGEVRDACLGHAIQGMRAHYDLHDYLPEKAEAMARWGEYVENLIEKKD